VTWKFSPTLSAQIRRCSSTAVRCRSCSLPKPCAPRAAGRREASCGRYEPRMPYFASDTTVEELRDDETIRHTADKCNAQCPAIPPQPRGKQRAAPTAAFNTAWAADCRWSRSDAPGLAHAFEVLDVERLHARVVGQRVQHGVQRCGAHIRRKVPAGQRRRRGEIGMGLAPPARTPGTTQPRCRNPLAAKSPTASIVLRPRASEPALRQPCTADLLAWSLSGGVRH